MKGEIEMTIKEARQFAGLTQAQVQDEFGVPIRTLQNWESGVRECPEYVEDMLKEKMIQSVRYAHIRWEKAFKIHDTDEAQQGFSCWLNDPEYDEMGFSWFYPVTDGQMSAQVVWKIGQLVEAGWKVYFIE